MKEEEYIIEIVINREWYTIVFYQKDKSDAIVKFNVFEVKSRTDEKTPQIYYSSTKPMEQDTLDYNNSKPIMYGFLKLDGCMDLNVHTHNCGYSNIVDIIMKDIYLEAANIIEGWDNENNSLSKNWTRIG